MKKLTLLFLIVFLGSLFFPLISLAGFYQADDKGVCYDGLVPCGKDVCMEVNDEVCGAILRKVQDLMEADPNLGPVEAFKEACKANGGRMYSELYPKEKELRCQFCHFFVMLDGIIEFAIKYVVIPVAVLMIVVGGIMFMFSQFGAAELLPGGIKGGPAMLSRAKSLITSVIIGLVIIFASYLIVGVVLAAMGLADTNPIKGWFTGDAFTINCPIKLSNSVSGPGPTPGPGPEPGPGMSILCEDWQRMADYFNVPHPAKRSTDLQNFLTCLESRTMQALPSEGAGNNFYGLVFTWDHDHEACNYNRGDTTCSACSHTHYSCHYGGGTGTEGALAVDFGNELNIIPIRQAANQCCQDIWGEDCFVLLEGEPPVRHIHISIPPCDRN